ncbi:hypothetical protein LINPERHAP2_LOCUS39865 [Linum perenne]
MNMRDPIGGGCSQTDETKAQTSSTLLHRMSKEKYCLGISRALEGNQVIALWLETKSERWRTKP